MKRKLIQTILACMMVGSFILTGCRMPKKKVETLPPEMPRPIETTEYEEYTEPEETTLPDYPCINPAFEGLSPEEIVAQLSLDEKAAQMVQGQYSKLPSAEMEINCYGSVLSYDQSRWPSADLDEWKQITRDYQTAALMSTTRIPYIYGNDFIHGSFMSKGNVIFPQHINLGAANDEDLVFEMGVITGSEQLHLGMLWNFAPCVATAKDPRWGRTYESMSDDEGIVTKLSTAFVKGSLTQNVVPCAKHYLGEGYAVYGTGEDSGGVDRLIDRGDAQMNDEQIEATLQIYKSLIEAGVPSIMVSHSALNGVKMHENTDFILKLKDEYGFEGVVLSDWNSLQNCSGETYKENVILCVNAGVDMLMEADRYAEAKDMIVEGVLDGSIPMERVDDAVTRIIRMKQNAGLFDDPFLDGVEPSYEFNSEHSHEVARELAAKSMVPLKLPEEGPMKIESGKKVFVCGPAANDSGALCGGWTYVWQGSSDQDLDGEKWCVEGPTILEALQEAAESDGYEIITDSARIEECDFVLLCVGEKPYAEWNGDTEDLSITGKLGLAGNEEAITLAKESGKPTLTLIVAGRNVLINDYIEDWDEIVMCYLPGSEGGNAAYDILTGKVDFYGRLPMPYYASIEQIGTEECWLARGFSAADTKNDTPDNIPGDGSSETTGDAANDGE